MEDFEKLYTLQDIADMTRLTPRTLRNYLKDGSLKGRKIGGQWRFTGDDIRKLFNSRNYSEENEQHVRQQVIDFWEGDNETMDSSVNVCTIINYPCQSPEQGHELYEKLVTVINGKEDEPVPARFDYAFNSKKHQARFTLFGSPGFIMDTLKKL